MKIYYHDAAFARATGDLDAYRESFRENTATRDALDRAISANFDGFRLNRQVLDITGSLDPDRVAIILAATITDKPYDGRFSRDNRDWARSVRFPDVDLHMISSRTHSAILDGFINLFRQANRNG